MSYSAIVYKVMIASPSDVSAERSIVREVLSEWNVVSSDARCQVLLPIGWETHSVPEMGDRPQALINKQILHDCDLLVGVFWTRIGTATGEYASGTVEEIEEHIKTGRPTMLYFSSAPVLPDSVDADQYRRLKEFKLSCQSRGLYEPYGDVQDFRTKLYRQLQLKVNRDAYFRTAAEPAGSPTILELEPGPTLSKEAAFLLKECVADPAGQVLHLSHLSGYVLQVRGKNLIEDNNDRSRAIWTSALEELENDGLLAAVGSKRNIFKVTRKGYEIVDQLP
ncbi:MAG: DUF4062 domain-containing protein [Rhodoferax sp.]|nr:DUF4062 domain-containing protein [Rhodoferax sp.]